MFRAPPGQWTIDTLNEHLTALLDQQDRDLRATIAEGLANSEKAVRDALAGTNKAIDKADIATDNRFQAVNEFRAQLGDLTRTFMPRIETEQRIDQSDAKTAALIARVDKMEGSKAAMYAIMGIAGSMAGLVIALVAVFYG